MNIPEGLLYTEQHEWIKIEGDNATVGITDFAQSSLGDVTFVELPKTGLDVKQFQGVAIIESVKAASDVFCPMAGKILETNSKIENNPGLVNQSCYADGWLIKLKIKDQSEKSNLMDATAYKKFTQGLGH